MHLKRLREVPLFERLDKRQVEMIGRLAEELDVEAGQVLAREGDFGREFFVIEDGTAEVTRGGERIAELEPGDFFGEIALIEEERRTATVTASTRMTVIVLSASAFRSLNHTMPAVFDTVKSEIVKRRAVPA